MKKSDEVERVMAEYERAMDAMFPAIKRVLWYEYLLSTSERFLPEKERIRRPSLREPDAVWHRYYRRLRRRELGYARALGEALREYERLRSDLWVSRRAAERLGIRRPEVVPNWALGLGTFYADPYSVTEP